MLEASEEERADFERVKVGLKRANITVEQSQKLFWDLAPGLVNGDLAFVHNMGLLAVQSGLVKEACSIGMDSLDNGCPGTTVAIAIAGLNSLPPSEASVLHKMLAAAAQGGHIRAKSVLWGHKLSKFGLFRFFILIPIRLGLGAHAFAIGIRDPRDTRVHLMGRSVSTR